MYIPENPDKCPGLWEDFAKSLSKPKVYTVSDGKGDVTATAKSLPQNEAEIVLQRFRDADIRRIGARHGKIAVPPHYALKSGEEGRTAFLCEYITLADRSDGTISIDGIKTELYWLAVVIFHDYPGIESINIPLGLPLNSDGTYQIQPMGTTRSKLVPLETPSEVSTNLNITERA